MTICKACGRAGARAVPGPQVRWSYWRCVRCGHAWLHPAPSTQELTRYYNTAYAVPRALYVAGVPRKLDALVSLLRRQSVRPGRMLEVGCSYGAMLDAFKRDGWDVEGIELDARAAAVARTDYGLRVHHGRFEDVRAELLGGYDAIALYHVLEHVPDPAALIRELAAICRPGGVLLVTTPNPRSFVARALGGWWEWYAAPEHLHLFSADSLRALLETHGFVPETVVSRRGDAHRTLFELVRGSSRRLLRRGVRGRVQLDGPGDGGAAPVSLRPWYRAAQRVIDVIGAPLDWLLAPFQSGRRLLGPELLVLARKPNAN